MRLVKMEVLPREVMIMITPNKPKINVKPILTKEIEEERIRERLNKYEEERLGREVPDDYFVGY